MTTSESKVETPVPQVPLTIKDRIGFFIFGGIALALGVYMVMEPVITQGDTSDVSRARTKIIVWIIEFIWSRPTGVVLGLLGLAILAAGIFSKTKDDPAYKKPTT